MGRVPAPALSSPLLWSQNGATPLGPGAAGRLAGLSRLRLGPRWRPLELGCQGDCWDWSRENPAREGALSAGGVADPLLHSCFSSHFLLKRGGFHREGKAPLGGRLLCPPASPRPPSSLWAPQGRASRPPGLGVALWPRAPSQPPACCWLLPPTVPSEGARAQVLAFTVEEKVFVRSLGALEGRGCVGCGTG